MMKSSSKSHKLLATTILTLFILSAFTLSGFTIATMDDQADRQLPPNEGPGAGSAYGIPNAGGEDGEQSADEEEESSTEPVNVIKNGDFEKPWETSDVAPDWEPYNNGRAEFGWYDEQWLEAVHGGEHAQLMEIFHVEANVLDRIIAVHQTVDVVPDAKYDLTIHALMRSQAPAGDRNKYEVEMHWGIDLLGEGNYDNVTVWHPMPLTEQFRLGSTGKFPEDVPLFYEIITGTVYTTDTNRITLFIRGLKKFSTGTEVNFDIDNVALVGPPPGTGPVVVVTPETPTTTSTEESSSLPTSGAILSENVSAGALILGGLVLVVLGTGAAVSLLQSQKER